MTREHLSLSKVILRTMRFSVINQDGGGGGGVRITLTFSRNSENFSSISAICTFFMLGRFNFSFRFGNLCMSEKFMYKIG